MASDILIVDDEADIRELVAGILEDEGYGARAAKDATRRWRRSPRAGRRSILLDIWLQGSRLDGLALLDVIKSQHPDLPVVMISGHGNIETAVSAIKRGAYDFIEKPFKADRLVLVAEPRARDAPAAARGACAEAAGLARPTLDRLLARDQPAAPDHRTRVAPTNSRILISGPSGSGKELAARVIHASSARADGPFVVLNAATITPERMEVELFGTEAQRRSRKIGALEEAHGGTLFIDEIADMPRETQNKILRVLVDQQFPAGRRHASGSTSTCASSPRPPRSGSGDRGGALPRGPVPPPERGADPRAAALPSGARTSPSWSSISSSRSRVTTGLPPRQIGDDAMAVLQAHDWPGNVRQLRNNVERLMILAGGDPAATITADMLPPEVGALVPAMPNGHGGEHLMTLPLRDAREMFEREYLVAQINRFGGNISRTAEFVGMERSALHRKLKALGVDERPR